MIVKRLARQPNCIGNGVGRQVAAPLLYDRFPSDACRHLLQNVPNQDSGSAECRLAMADRRIGDDKSPDDALNRLLPGFCHGGCLSTIIAGTKIDPPPLFVRPSFLNSLTFLPLCDNKPMRKLLLVL